ncbi:MAG: hypothetical protein V9H69_20475 [Anaerolineae bacterium]
MVHFIAAHPNITGGVAFHTYSGVLLRPFSTHPDDDMPAEDLWTFQKIGQRGQELTGYPAVSVFHDFRYHPKEVITGALDDWLYDHVGVYAWTVEIWSPQRQAGIEEYKYIDWFRQHPFEDDRKMLAWSDEKLGGQGYVDWYPFLHPQLGPVELGGWNAQLAFRNPPPAFLEQELALFPRWLLWHLAISPRLELLEASADAAGRRRVSGAAGGQQQRLAAQLRHQESRAAQGRARRGGRDRAAGGRNPGHGQATRGAGPTGRSRLSGRRAAGLERRRHRRSAEGRMGGGRAGRRPAQAAGPAPARRRGARRAESVGTESQP